MKPVFGMKVGFFIQNPTSCKTSTVNDANNHQVTMAIPSFFKIRVKTMTIGFIILCFLLGAVNHVFAVEQGTDEGDTYTLDNGCAITLPGTYSYFPNQLLWHGNVDTLQKEFYNDDTLISVKTFNDVDHALGDTTANCLGAECLCYWDVKLFSFPTTPECNASPCDDADGDGVCNEQNPQNFGPPSCP